MKEHIPMPRLWDKIDELAVKLDQIERNLSKKKGRRRAGEPTTSTPPTN